MISISRRLRGFIKANRSFSKLAFESPMFSLVGRESALLERSVLNGCRKVVISSNSLNTNHLQLYEKLKDLKGDIDEFNKIELLKQKRDLQVQIYHRLKYPKSLAIDRCKDYIAKDVESVLKILFGSSKISEMENEVKITSNTSFLLKSVAVPVHETLMDDLLQQLGSLNSSMSYDEYQVVFKKNSVVNQILDFYIQLISAYTAGNKTLIPFTIDINTSSIVKCIKKGVSVQFSVFISYLCSALNSARLSCSEANSLVVLCSGNVYTAHFASLLYSDLRASHPSVSVLITETLRSHDTRPGSLCKTDVQVSGMKTVYSRNSLRDNEGKDINEVVSGAVQDLQLSWSACVKIEKQFVDKLNAKQVLQLSGMPPITSICIGQLLAAKFNEIYSPEELQFLKFYQLEPKFELAVQALQKLSGSDLSPQVITDFVRIYQPLMKKYLAELERYLHARKRSVLFELRNLSEFQKLMIHLKEKGIESTDDVSAVLVQSLLFSFPYAEGVCVSDEEAKSIDKEGWLREYRSELSSASTTEKEILFVFALLEKHLVELLNNTLKK